MKVWLCQKPHKGHHNNRIQTVSHQQNITVHYNDKRLLANFKVEAIS